MKQLWLGLGPDNYDSKKDILLGPWCVLGKEKVYPDINKIEFAPDPITSLEEMRYSESLTRNFAESYLPILAGELNNKLGVNHSDQFWRIILMPWLLTLVQITWLKQRLINNFIKAHKDEEIFVELIDNSIKWDYENHSDFMMNGVNNIEFSHWLFSRLIENNIPENWKISYRKCTIKKHYDVAKLLNPTLKVRIAEKLEVLFPLFGINGINVFEAILFEIVNKIKIRRIKEQEPIIKTSYNRSNNDIQWNLDWDSIVKNIFPKDFLSITHKQKTPYKFRGVLFGTSGILHHDFKKRLKLALSVDSGAQLIGIQHGGAYGTFAVHSLVSAVEYGNSHKFFSWGWEKTSYQKEKIIPVSSPYLSKLRYSSKTEDIIFVSGIFAVLPVRINSFKQPNQVIKERNEIFLFIKSLNDKLLSNFFYRPSFSLDVGGPPSILDEEFINSNFPSVRMIKGDLHTYTMKSKLLIINQPGTTFHIAMAANIPTICYWNPEFYWIDKKADPYFKALREVGITYDNPIDSAKKANKIWNDVNSWWQNPVLQKARTDWVWNYARTSKHWRREWIKIIWRL
jgi:putative transferase (TIGR04331 family)